MPADGMLTAVLPRWFRHAAFGSWVINQRMPPLEGPRIRHLAEEGQKML
jgi:hypothetical protein